MFTIMHFVKNYDKITMYQKLNTNFISKNIRYLDYDYVFKYQRLTEEFILNHSQFSSWNTILKYQKILFSKSTLIKYLKYADISDKNYILNIYFVNKLIDLGKIINYLCS